MLYAVFSLLGLVFILCLVLIIKLNAIMKGPKNTEEMDRLERILRSDAKDLREEMNQNLLNFNDSIRRSLEERLEVMRATVDEKLHSTLEKRLGESFSQVSERLEQVHKGLGEMQTLANDVGGLKRVLTNVKTRGTWGEVQLGNLLEQMLAPEQYIKNAHIKENAEVVEYAVKLPDEVLIPIDSKFPIETYERLIQAGENADVPAVEQYANELEKAIKLQAKLISEKYILVPKTTNFAIMFLPTEGLYAEVMKRAGLDDFVQRKYHIAITGPSTLAAYLNALQMGFKTLAIQKRSSEVWHILGEAKTEFNKYGDWVEKVKRQLEMAHKTLDEAETRTRAVNRKLRDIESDTEISSDSLPDLLTSTSTDNNA